MAKIRIRPLDDRVIVEPIAAEETTAGGILLPDSAKEKPQRGTVVAVGPGRLLDNGQRGELSVVVGDEVIYGKYGGTDITLEGSEVKILRESDILALVGEPTTPRPNKKRTPKPLPGDPTTPPPLDYRALHGDPTTGLPDDDE